MLEVPLTSMLEVLRLPLVILGAGDWQGRAHHSPNEGETLGSLSYIYIHIYIYLYMTEREREDVHGMCGRQGHFAYLPRWGWMCRSRGSCKQD